MLLVVLLPAVVQAQFTFTTNNGALTIASYTGSGGEVTIPNMTNGYPVTSIGNNAFYNKSSLTSVTIPNGVTSMGTYVFYNCSNLTNATIGSGIIGIGNSTFYQCYKLASVTIPDTTASIGVQAFAFCTSLTSITIPNSVTNIGSYAFYHCTGLTSVTIPNSVTSIGNSAFFFCSSVTNITIPDSVTTIGIIAFAGLNSLTAFNVTASNPVYSSFNGVLFNKSKTILVQYPGGLAGSYRIPETVTSIGDAAFYGSGLTSVTIPESVTNFVEDAFTYSYSLTSVTIPKSVTSIGQNAFAYCLSLTAAYFEGNAPPDNSYIFYDSPTTVFYLPGMTGWGATFGGQSTVLWNPQAQIGDGSFGMQNNQFGFNITGSSNLVIVVEAATNLANPVWSPVSTNTLNTFVGTNGTSYFSDPQWTNNPAAFYRLRSP